MTRHFTIMVIDIESFSTRSDPVQRSLRAAMYDVMRSAVTDAHLDWGRFHSQDRGDGLLLLIEADQSPVDVVGDLVRALQRQLAEKEQMFSPQHRLRLRVALHHGLATPDNTGWSGDAVNTACRLVDAQQVRVALDEARSAQLALIVSDSFYQSVIRPGHRSIDTATFLPVDIDAKNLRAYRCWIQVPGYPAPPGVTAVSPQRPAPVGGVAEPVQPAAPTSAAPADPSVPAAGRSYTLTIHGPVHGDIIQGDKPMYGGEQ
jgi:hypothetical protein